MATDTGFGKVKIFDDFVGHTKDVTHTWAEATDGGSSEISDSIDDNGYVRLSTGTTDTWREAIHGEVIWEAENGGLIFETRIKSYDAITTRAYFVGFTDIKTVEMPAEMNAAVLTCSAANCVGFMYDTDADNDYWYCASSKTVKTTPVNTSVAPKTTDQTLRVEVNVDGDARFYIDGKYEGSIENAVTASTKLSPCVYIENRLGTTTRSVDVDYIYVEGGRS